MLITLFIVSDAVIIFVKVGMRYTYVKGVGTRQVDFNKHIFSRLSSVSPHGAILIVQTDRQDNKYTVTQAKLYIHYHTSVHRIQKMMV